MIEQSPQTPLQVAAPYAVFALIVGVLATISGMQVDWTTWKQATCMPDGCFCEHLRHDFIRQPANTWSNMGFVWVGLLIIFRPLVATAALAPMRDVAAYRVAFGVMAMFVGLGSWLYHASMTFVGQWFDVMAMYLLPTFLIAYNFVRLNKLDVRGFIASWLFANVLLGCMLIYLAEIRRPVFGALLVSLVVSEVWTRRQVATQLNGKLMLAAIGAIVAAFTIWTLDLRHIVCDPHSLLQGHAAWHLLCALSTWFLYRYYASAK